MGNCLNAISSDPSLPSSNCIGMNNTTRLASVSPLDSNASPFTFVLPFTAHSNLGALYALGAELGRGQSGIVRRCTSRSSGALYACKSISKLRLRTMGDVEDVIREVRIMKHLSQAQPTASTNHISPHSHLPGNIVRLYDVIEDEAFLHLIMELCHGGDLFDRIAKEKCYPEARAAFLMKSLLESVQFCHSMGIMHRDIKPENILLVKNSDTSTIKLADFGLAVEFCPGQKFSDMAGSAYYIAPEVLQGEYSEEIDVWSAGVILYGLLSGVPPFCGSTEQRIFKAIQGGQLSFPPDKWDKISSSAKDMITQLLHPDAKSRLTPEQALKHPWILYHTRGDKQIQLNSTSNMSTSSTILAVQKDAGNLGPHTSTCAPTHNQALLRAGMRNAAKPELNKFLVDVIVGMDRSTVSVSDSLVGKRLQNGWTSTLLTLNENGETLVVDMGQDRYLVSHDRTRKKIEWKLLKEKSASLNSHLFGQPQ